MMNIKNWGPDIAKEKINDEFIIIKETLLEWFSNILYLYIINNIKNIHMDRNISMLLVLEMELPPSLIVTRYVEIVVFKKKHIIA